MKIENAILRAVKQLLSHQLKQTTCSYIFLLILNVVRFIEILALVIHTSTIFQTNYSKNSSNILDSLLIIFIIFQSSILILISWRLLNIHNKIKRQNLNFQLNFFQKLSQKFIFLGLQIFRLNLFAPLLYLSLYQPQINHSGQSQKVGILALINMILAFSLTYPLSGLIFFNKMAVKTQSLSFPYIINIQSITYAFLPILIILKMSSQVSFSIFGIILTIFCLIFMYIHPCLNYRNNKLNQFGCSSIISLIFLKSMYYTIGYEINNISQLLIFIISSVAFSYVLLYFQQNRMKKLLLLKKQQQNHMIDSIGYRQNLFFYFSNYSQFQNQIKLYLFTLIQNLQKAQQNNKNDNQEHNINKKCLQKNQLKFKVNSESKYQKKSQSGVDITPKISLNAFSPSKISSQIHKINSNSTQNSIQNVSYELIDCLMQNNSNSQKIQKQFYQLLILKLRTYYDPKKYKLQGLGRQQLLKKLTQNQNTYVLILQSLLLSEKNHFNTYYYIKQHQQLLKQAQVSRFFDQIYNLTVVSLIQQKLGIQKKLNPQFNLKAQYYFQFNQEFQLLQQQTIYSCQNNIQFWKECLKQDPDEQRLQKNIHLNYILQKKIFKHTKKILQKFEQSSQILHGLISQYNQLILNLKIEQPNSLYIFLNNQRNKKLKIKSKQYDRKSIKQNIIKDYSIQKDVGVFMIDLQSLDYNIQWGNRHFISQFLKDQNFIRKRNARNASRNSQNCLITSQLNKKSRKMNDEYLQKQSQYSFLNLIFPQLRQSHKMIINNFITQSDKINYTHERQTFLFIQAQNRFQTVLLQLQLLPSLTNGLKMLGFVHKNSINTDKYTQPQLILNSQLKFIACNQQFLHEYKQFFNEEQYQNNSEDISFCVDYLLKNQSCAYFTQTIKSQASQQNQTLQANISLSNSDYKIKLQRKIYFQQYSTNIQNQLQQVQSKCLYVISFDNLTIQDSNQIESMQEQKKQVQNLKKMFKNESIKTTTLNFNQLLQKSATNYSTNSMVDQAILSLRNNFKDEIRLEEQAKLYNKCEQQLLLQKDYNIIISTKNSKKIILWKGFTTLLTFILIICIIWNIITFNNKKLLYEQSKNILQNFGQLSTNLAQIIIALRQLNYQAYIYGPQSPQISYILNKLKSQQKQIDYNLKLLAPYFKQQWNAYQINSDGSITTIQDDSYVIISNYMLSGITYVSQVNPKQMKFPIFVTLLYTSQQSLYPSNLSFLQAVYNGLYVILPKVDTIRQELLAKQQNQLKDVSKIYFLYSCLIGIFSLIMFLLVSMWIQNKSQNILEQTATILNDKYVTKVFKQQKLQNLLNFRSRLQQSIKEGRILNKQNNFHKTYQFVSKTIRDFPKIQQFVKEKNQNQINEDNIDLIKQNSVFCNNLAQQTNRQLKMMESSSQVKSEIKTDEFNSSQLQRQIKYKKTQQNSANNSKIKLFKRTRISKIWKVCFYVIVCLPSICYFIGVLIGGLNVNQTIIKQLRMVSQISNRLSNQQQLFLAIRQIPYYQLFSTQYFQNWSTYTMSIIQKNYQKDRLVQQYLNQPFSSQNIDQILDSIQDGNLCQYLDNFKQSQYYGIKFTKQQCESFSFGIFTKGFKQVLISYYQTALQLTQKYPNPQWMSFQQRFSYLQSQSIHKMKIILAYTQQFMKQIILASQNDLQQTINGLINNLLAFSIISIFCLSILFITINYRWKKMLKHKKQVQSIISLISFTTLIDGIDLKKKNQKIVNNSLPIKTNAYFHGDSLRKKFKSIDWNFYK